MVRRGFLGLLIVAFLCATGTSVLQAVSPLSRRTIGASMIIVAFSQLMFEDGPWIVTSDGESEHVQYTNEGDVAKVYVTRSDGNTGWIEVPPRGTVTIYGDIAHFQNVTDHQMPWQPPIEY